MKKDIIIPKVENVQVAVVRKKNELNQEEWAVFLLNRNGFLLENVLVTSSGYGEKDKEVQNTATLRHFLGNVAANNFQQIELIEPAVFHLNNEYWVSYWVGNQMFDKKFIFVPDSIVEANIIQIPLLEMEGILHA